MSPSTKTSGCPGSCRCPSTVTRPARSTSAPAARASSDASGEALTPAAQITVRAPTSLRSPPAAAIATVSGPTSTTVWPVSGVTPSRSSACAALRESEAGKAGSMWSVDSTSRTRDARVSIERKSRRSVSCASSAIWPAISTPVGPPPTTTNVSHACRRSSSGSTSAASNARQDPSPDVERAFERFQLGRELLPVVVAEVRIARSSRDDERVIRDRLPLIAVRQLVEDHLATLQVEARHLREQDTHVLLTPEDAAQRRTDLGGRERAGRNLVGEWLEEVEVAAVDERHLDRGPAQLAHRLQPREAASHDDDPRATIIPRCLCHATDHRRTQARPRAFARA